MSSFSGVQPEESGTPRAQVRAEDAANLVERTHATELFRQAQLGDRGAFAQIVQLYQDRLYNAILRMVGDHDDARDLTQDCFTRALEKIDTFRGEAQPYTWLFRIGLNLSISEIRKSQRRRTFTVGENGQNSAGEDQASSLLERVAQDRDADSDPSHQAETRERSQQVVESLGRIDPEYRAILIMRDVEGFDYQQMADILNLPLGTLKSRLFRARIALRDELKPYIEGKTKH